MGRDPEAAGGDRGRASVTAMTDMEQWGLDAVFAEAFAEHESEGRIPGRVVRASGHPIDVVTPWGEMAVRVLGQEAPTVGDWVAVDGERGEVVALLPRRSVIARSRPGRASGQQVLAANVDLALVLTGLDDDFSVRRIERYLAIAAAGDVGAALVLNKADLTERREAQLAEVERVAGGRPVIVASILHGEGVDEIRRLLPAGRTAVLLGSSGVGKSTLINALLGEARARTRSVASDGRGRHVTTHRELFQIEGGGLVADVPGIREVGLVGTQQDVEDAFADVAALAAGCRFKDCAHAGEPGCAVEEAVEQGALEAERLDSYRALSREAEAHARRSSEHLRRAHERATYGRWRKQLQKRRGGSE